MDEMDNTSEIIDEFFPGKSFTFQQRKIINWIIGKYKLSSVLSQASGKQGLLWIESVFESLQIRCDTNLGGFDNIPNKGPAIVVSNHPTVIDGLVLINTVARVRKDIKIVANHVLKVMFPQASEMTIGIRNMQGKIGHRQLKEMNEHLQRGGVLIICPAGRLARLSLTGLKESCWNEGFVRLAAKNGAVLVPVYIRGVNTLWYYLTAFIWRPLSNLMILREIIRHKSRRIQLKICPQVLLSDNGTDKKDYAGIAALFQEHLQRQGRNQSPLFPVYPPLSRPVPKELLLNSLNQCEVLEQHSDGKIVFLYHYQEDGWSPVIHELGRLREISYRETGTGTGRRRDIDRFDREYFHIVLWEPRDLEIVGAYRLVAAGEQLAKRGIDGLYSYSLFKYPEKFLPQLEKSIEIGRGFIQYQYQKTNALDILWKGIFSVIRRYPDAKYFLGALSIPGGFSCEAKGLIVFFYDIYFSAGGVKFSPDKPYTIKQYDITRLFDGGNYEKDWRLLNEKLRELGYELPWPYKQAAKWYRPGGSKVLCFIEDDNFNSIAGLNLCEIEKLKKMYYTHYVTRGKLGSNIK